MSIFNALHNSTSGLTLERLRMDTASSNMANANTTRGAVNEAGEAEPYQRKMVEAQPHRKSFQSYLAQANQKTNTPHDGVEAARISEDTAPPRQEYDPNHPDANEEGYVAYPNVDPLKEMVDMMSATRSYEANVTATNASKNMLLKALEIGKQ